MNTFDRATELDILGRFSLRVEYKESLLQAQPQTIQNFFLGQARLIIQALDAGKQRIRFSFPEYVLRPLSSKEPLYQKESLSPRYRRQQVGRMLRRNDSPDLIQNLMDRLFELRRSANTAISTCADLLCFLLARQLLESLPEGKPFISQGDPHRDSYASNPDIALNQTIQSASRNLETEFFNEKMSCFYLPQWVAFNSNGELILPTEQEAKERIQCMRNYMHRLLLVLAIDPAITGENAFRQRYFGMVSQWTHQGRAYAQYQTLQIIHTIRQRAQQNSLNRGLSLSLPFFDDQALELRTFDFEVIPPGRILFEPFFVVQAVEDAKVRVSGDPSLNDTTKHHLLAELDLLQKSFAFHQHFAPIGLLLQSNAILSNLNHEVQRKISR